MLRPVRWWTVASVRQWTKQSLTLRVCSGRSGCLPYVRLWSHHGRVGSCLTVLWVVIDPTTILSMPTVSPSSDEDDSMGASSAFSGVRLALEGFQHIHLPLECLYGIEEFRLSLHTGFEGLLLFKRWCRSSDSPLTSVSSLHSQAVRTTVHGSNTVQVYVQ